MAGQITVMQTVATDGNSEVLRVKSCFATGVALVKLTPDTHIRQKPDGFLGIARILCAHMAGDGEIKKLRKDVAKSRREIVALQRRLQAFLLKRKSKDGANPPSAKAKPND